MTEMTLRKEPVTLAQCEARIQIYKEQTVGGLIGIGRTLNEAKEAKVVPHGQWEAWVEEQTGVSVRQAQRMMQLAREVGEGSSLNRLDFSTALLVASSGLESDAQESLAQTAADGRMTRAEVQRLIAQAKDDAKLEAQKEYGEQLERQARMDHAVLADAERQHREELEKQRKKLAQEANQLILDNREAVQNTIAELEEKIRTLETAAAQAGEDERLRGQIGELQAMLEKQTQARKEAQAELLRMKAAHGNRAAVSGESKALDLRQVEAARDTFLAGVGEMRYMGARFSMADATEKQRWRDALEPIARWLRDAMSALETVSAEGGVGNE